MKNLINCPMILRNYTYIGIAERGNEIWLLLNYARHASTVVGALLGQNIVALQKRFVLVNMEFHSRLNALNTRSVKKILKSQSANAKIA